MFGFNHHAQGDMIILTCPKTGQELGQLTHEGFNTLKSTHSTLCEVKSGLEELLAPKEV